MNTELKKAIDLATEAVEQLQKSGVGGSIHTETLLKSHVKEYTRTTASGASVQVNEHDDKRQAAEEATKAAEKPAGSKFRSGSAKYQAADKEAFEAGDKAKTKEDHAKAAALHLKAAGHAEKDSADEDLHMNMVKEHNRSAK